MSAFHADDGWPRRVQQQRWVRFESDWVLRILRWGSLLVPAALIAAFGIATWDQAIDDAKATARGNANLIREYTLRLIQTQDIQLSAGELRFDSPDASDLRAVHEFIKALRSNAGASLGLALIAPNGDYLVSSGQYPDDRSVGQRDYLDAALAGAPNLFVDRINIQPANVDSLVVARRHRTDPSPGVWVSAVSIDAITSFLKGIIERPGDSASIMRSDGRLLVRNFDMPEAVVLAPDSQEMRALRQGDRGVFEAKAGADGVRRIYAFARIGELDLYARYGVAKQALLAGWLRRLGFVATLLGTIGVVGHLLARYAARSMAAEAARASLEFDRKLLVEAEKTAEAKQMMLKELNHRVKNNLQVIRSLIRLQGQRPEGPDLEEIAARVMAIAEIHDLLYRSADSFNVDLAALLRAICDNDSIVAPESPVRVVCSAEPLSVDANLATPLALCTVELITNALKHAFGPEGGSIAVNLEHGEGQGRLTVADNGKGHEASPRSSGLRVVDALVAQIAGDLTVSREDGTRIEIVFPLPCRGAVLSSWGAGSGSDVQPGQFGNAGGKLATLAA